MISPSRPAHGTVVAYLALFVALGGTGAFATHELINSSDVVNESLTGADIRGRDGTDTVAGIDGRLTGADVSGQPPVAGTGQPFVDGSLTTWDIRDGTLVNADLGTGAVASNSVSDGSLGSADLTDESVGTADLGPNAVGSSEIRTGSVTYDEIADRSVHYTEIGQTPAARATTSGRVGVADLAQRIIPFGVQSFDKASLFTTDQPTRMTASVAGTYVISASVSWEFDADHWRNLLLCKNRSSTCDGAEIIAGQMTSAHSRQSATTIDHLDVGDYVEAAVVQRSGETLDVEGALSVAWVGP